MYYSRNAARQDNTALIRDTAIMLRSEISKPGKIRYWLHRIFLPVRKREWNRL
jgi:hypothetical protein